ncbi:Gamma-glutamyl hydrolase 2 [Orobanche gracilis]
MEVLRKNDAGDHFPLLAICLGFELVIKIVMFPPTLLKKLSTECLVMQHHKFKQNRFEGFGISPEKIQKNKRLHSFLKIITTSADEDDKVYVSTVQARRYPVTGVQFHREKNAFEWGLSGIPHSEDAVQVNQHVANFLVSGGQEVDEQAIVPGSSRQPHLQLYSHIL